MAKRLPQRPLSPRSPRRAAPMTAPSRLAAALWMGLALGATTVGLAQAPARGPGRGRCPAVFSTFPPARFDRALGGFASAAGVELFGRCQPAAAAAAAPAWRAASRCARLRRAAAWPWPAGRAPVPMAASRSMWHPAASADRRGRGAGRPRHAARGARAHDSAPPETATGPVVGYVAKRSASGTKTDASLLETPQLVNVVTRTQMDDRGARTVAEALRYTAGVLAEPNGFDVRYDWNYIRGFNTFGTQWLDGLAAARRPGQLCGAAHSGLCARARRSGQGAGLGALRQGHSRWPGEPG